MEMEQKLTSCKTCGKEIAVSAKNCPHCGAKTKKPIFKKWWFWLLVVFVIGMIASTNGKKDTPKPTPDRPVESTLPESPKKGPEASPTSSSAAATATPETTPEPASEPAEEETMGQKNALRSAKNYLSVMAFSHSGLIEQLEFEGYSTEDATYAADNCGADWNEQAAKAAQNYLNIMSFSKSGLIEQLEFEGYSHEQATYGAEANGY